MHGECECGASESPCKVDPIRLDQLPEIQCCVETIYGTQCEQTAETRCPSGVDEVRDASGNIVSPAIPPSRCDMDSQMCVYEFTTRGQPDFMQPSCSYEWEQQEQAQGRGSSELVFLYTLQPDHAVELRLMEAHFDAQVEIRTSQAGDGGLSECPGVDSFMCISSSGSSVGSQYMDNTGVEPINVWIMVEAVGTGVEGMFSLLWQTTNMCTYGKSCHDGSCVEERACEGGWYAGVPAGNLVSATERRSQIQVSSRWSERSPSEQHHHLSPEECALEVQIVEPNANGATFQQGVCFAEVDLEVRPTPCSCFLLSIDGSVSPPTRHVNGL
eukprot:COSAG06_NODE_1117_length_10639_cov_3.469355_2_plen_328_part_00